MNTRPCRVCGSASDVMSLSDRRGVWYDCPTCGPYGATFDALDDLEVPAAQPLLMLLSAHLRQAVDRGEELILTTTNWRGFAEAHARVSVPMKIRRVFELIAAGAKPAAWTQPDMRLLALRADVVSDDEREFILAAIEERGLIERERIPSVSSPGSPREPDPPPRFKLTVKGWEALDPILGAGVPGTCFVAMSLAPEMRSAFDDGIQPAVETDCELEVVRVDRIEHNDKIDDFIIAGIRRAQCVVVDVTLQRQNVYFEAGFAVGLGRAVIWCCRENDLQNAHFDTRQFNHIVWTEPADLRRKLAARIRATVALNPRL